MNDNTIDRKATRIQVSSEEARKNEAARVQLEHQKEELKLQRARKKMLLKEERRQAHERAKLSRNQKRQNARKNISTKISAALPTTGRRAMIIGPILAPMTVAWIGQIGFAHDKLGWPILGALVFAAAWELTTAFTGWMYHQARKDGDRGTLFRFATWLFACSAGAMNYWHACPVITERLNAQTVRQHINLDPNPKAVSYGAMSLVGIALWELYSSLIHRKELRAKGIVSSARPRFGILRWVRFTRITWHAWSLAVRHGIKTVDEAWSAAVAEIDHRRLAKDKRPEVRVTVVRTVTRTVPPQKSVIRLYRVEHPDLHWGLDPRSEPLALSGSQTGPGNGSETGPARRSETQTSTGSATGPGNRSETRSGNRSETHNGTRSGTRNGDGSETGPVKRSRRRSKTGPKVKVSDRLAEAKSVDKAYLSEHGRHIPAEKLAKALSIGKPAALDLVKQVRGGHIDVAK